MTRQNTVISENGNDIINALIPVWDICNHTNGTISTDYNPLLNQSECLALRDFKAGEQLFIFYGTRTNSELFIHNGFVYEDNVHDKYWLRLGLSKSDNLLEQRTNILNNVDLSTINDFFITKGSKSIDGQILAFARVFNMDEDQLQYWLKNKSCNDLLNFNYILDKGLEKKSWDFLQARLKLLLSAYKTTLEMDESLIAGNQLTANKLLAIKMRASEKVILKEALECVQKQIEKL